jgi:signal peptidase II
VTSLRWSLATASLVLIGDQLTKWWVVERLRSDPIEVIGGFLQLRYITNSGAAFSMLQGAGALIALVAIAVVVFVIMLARKVEWRSEAIGLGLVLGGAMGNLADRLFRGPGLLDGAVVDWVDFSFFPAFNVADAAITVGAGLLLVMALFRGES